MHFIDYLPLPVYVSILVVSGVGLVIYIKRNKVISKTEKIGLSFLIPQGIALIIMKFHEKNHFNENFRKILWVLVIIGFIGFYIAMVAGYKRISNPSKKRQVRVSLIFIFVMSILIGLLALYTIIVKG